MPSDAQEWVAFMVAVLALIAAPVGWLKKAVADGDDRVLKSSLARIELHEKECAERTKRMDERHATILGMNREMLDELREMRREMRER